MKPIIRRAAPGLLLALTGAGCGSTEIASISTDRVRPTVSIAIEGAAGGQDSDSVSTRLPLRVSIDAQDNAVLHSVVTRVFADTTLVGRDSSAFGASSATYQKTIQIPLSGIRPGQLITVRSTVSDGAGNFAEAEATAIAFDPNVPRMGFVQAQPNVIAGGSYTFDLAVGDSLGVAKAGYRATASGFSRADSVLFPLPYPTSDTLTFNVPLPPSLPVGTTVTIVAFAENRDGVRGSSQPFAVRVVAAGPDVASPIVYQSVPARLESQDSITIQARDSDGLVRSIGFAVKDAAGNVLHRFTETLSAPVQQLTVRRPFSVPVTLRGRTLFVTAFATDAAGHTGYAVANGASVPVSADSLGRRDQAVFAYGLTYGLPAGSLGADIAVDGERNAVFVSNIAKNQVEAFTYSTTLQPLDAISVGAQPWGMIIDNSSSLLLVANSGGTNVSRVSLVSRTEVGRVKTSNEYIFDVEYSKDDNSGGFKFNVSAPIDYSDRPQFIAQSASGALYYSTKPTNTATPGTLRRIDNFLDARAEPRQIWQYGAYSRGHYVIVNADFVDVIKGQQGVADSIVVCDHTPGSSPTTAVCETGGTVEAAVAGLRGSVNSNVEAVKDLDYKSLALPDTNFVAVGGDRRRVAFGEGNTGGRAGRVLLVYDPNGTPADGAQYSAPIEVADLTNNASDRIFGIGINANSTNIGVHGVETFFADSSLRLQGKFATVSTGAGIAFHPRNSDESGGNAPTRVVFVASGDKSVQIVDSYNYRLRGRIPIRENLYGPLRAALPTAAELEADPTLAVKLFGLTSEGLVVIDVRQADIDNLSRP